MDGYGWKFEGETENGESKNRYRSLIPIIHMMSIENREVLENYSSIDILLVYTWNPNGTFFVLIGVWTFFWRVEVSKIEVIYLGSRYTYYIYIYM